MTVISIGQLAATLKRENMSGFRRTKILQQAFGVSLQAAVEADERASGKERR